MLSNCGVGEDSWESLGLQGDPTSPFRRKSSLNSHWKDLCWSSNTLATCFEGWTHWKGPWCWERLKAGGKGDDRGCDGWMASPTQWTWVWANSGGWWRTGWAGVLRSMQRVKHHFMPEQQQGIITLASPSKCHRRCENDWSLCWQGNGEQFLLRTDCVVCALSLRRGNSLGTLIPKHSF